MFFLPQLSVAQQFDFSEIKHSSIAEQLKQLTDRFDLPRGLYSLSEDQPEVVVDKLYGLRGESRKCVRIQQVDKTFPDCINYRLIVKVDTIIFNTPEKLRKGFSPLRTAGEALLYAQIITGYSVVEDFSFWRKQLQNEKKIYNKKKKQALKQKKQGEHNAKWDYGYWYCINPSLETSYIVKVPEGWEMLLYKEDSESGSKYYSRRKLLIATDGTIENLAYDLVFIYDNFPY